MGSFYTRALREALFDVLGVTIFISAVFVIPSSVVYNDMAVARVSPFAAQLSAPPSSFPMPSNVRAIHLSYGSFGPRSAEFFLENSAGSQINAVIITIKDELGRVALYDSGKKEQIRKFLETMHAKEIYVIARLVTFQDQSLASARPDLAIYNARTGRAWENHKGLTWMDPTQQEVWAYNAAIAKEAVEMGFDEINFDYIRFPTGGPVSDAKYAHFKDYDSRVAVLEAFFKFIRDELGEDPILSIDVFGVTFTDDDVNIGQHIETIQKYFDVIAPMPYPSHFPPGFLGFQNPAQYPYQVLAYTLKSGFERLDAGVTVRPWLQDFNLGAIYDVMKIQEQIRAAKDQDIHTWALWNASDRYTFEAVK